MMALHNIKIIRNIQSHQDIKNFPKLGLIQTKHQNMFESLKTIQSIKSDKVYRPLKKNLTNKKLKPQVIILQKQFKSSKKPPTDPGCDDMK